MGCPLDRCVHLIGESFYVPLGKHKSKRDLLNMNI